MSLIVLIPLIIFVVAIFVITIIVFRNFPKLRVLNVNSSVKEKAKKVKEDIILRRLSRGSGAPALKLSKAVTASVGQVRKIGRKAIHRLRDLEEHYRDVKEKGSDSEVGQETLQRAMEEAGQFTRQEQYPQAEKKLIEIITLNPRFADAYEALGRLYTKMKSYEQAVESLKHALKLEPNDASALTALGEVYMSEEQWTKAFENFEKAVAKRPGNPKYLDLFIESSLKASKFTEAKKGISMLKDTNPENQKIKEFEERLFNLNS